MFSWPWALNTAYTEQPELLFWPGGFSSAGDCCETREMKTVLGDEHCWVTGGTCGFLYSSLMMQHDHQKKNSSYGLSVQNSLQIVWTSQNLETSEHLPFWKQGYLRGLPYGRFRSGWKRHICTQLTGKQWNSLPWDVIETICLHWFDSQVDKFLEEKNPSNHPKHLSNHTVYGVPARPWHHLDTRASEIVSVEGPVGRGWQSAQLSALQPCLTSVGPVLQVSKTSPCSRDLLIHPAAKIHVLWRD